MNPEELYSILSHEFRRKILHLLEKEGFVQYSDLMDRLGLELTGQLNFHLKKLGSLIGKDKKSYFLTEEGKRALQIISLNEKIIKGEDIEYLKSKGSDINRIGVIICDCNTEISKIINVHNLEVDVGKMNNVVSVKILDNLCQEKNIEKVINWVKENFLNKLVIAACSPKTHQHLFEYLLHDAIESSNIEIANIREQCCWVHFDSKKQKHGALTYQKAKLLIEVAVERVNLQGEVKVKRVDVEKACAIFGGGIAGMNLALNLSRAGIKVYLIEKSPTLGGMVARWHRISNMGDCSICFISELIGELVKEENVEIHTNTEIENISGEVGNFTIELKKNPRYVDEKKCTGCQQCVEICGNEQPNEYEFGLIDRKTIHFPFQNCYPYTPIINTEVIEKCRECQICERACVNKAINLNQKAEILRVKVGAKVIAIGSNLYSNLDEYHHDPKNDIITSAEFERMLSSDGITGGKLIKLSDHQPINSVSIIQEVGPSNYLCSFSDTLALKYLNDIKLKNSECEVNIFYNLDKVSQKEEILLRSTHPRFLYANELSIENREGHNCVIADSIEFPSDLIVLNLNLVPNRDLRDLRKTLDFTLDENGFMSNETLASGIFGVGTILGPLDYNATISSTNTVALKIITLLSKQYIYSEFTGIELDEDKCGYCGLCINSCPFNAITIDKDKLNIDKFKCKGCGTCVSVCPTNAIEMNIDTSEKIMKSIDVFSKAQASPKIIAFCCQSCGYAAADDAGFKKLAYNPNIFIVRVPCTGRIDTDFILKSFNRGFDGVMIVGCRRDACRYIDGIHKVHKKIRLLKRNLSSKMRRRIILLNLNAIEGQKFAESVNKFQNVLQLEGIHET
jgi:heterodisulfide reductase subunit A